jgi:hypothetical protein
LVPGRAFSRALMLAVTPWYFFLGCFSDMLASALLYHHPLKSFSELLSTIGTNLCCAAAAYLLRGPLFNTTDLFEAIERLLPAASQVHA